MKPIIRSILISFTVLLFTLSPAPCRAVTLVKHNFHTMYYAKPEAMLELTNSGKTGTSKKEDGIVYTCSGGALFSATYDKTNSEVAIFLENSSARFVTTTQIQNLDSIWIQYAPDANVKMTVQISEDSVRWTNVVLDESKNSIRKAKLSQPGDYYVRIAYKNTNVYIKEIDYTCLDPLSGCPNCFIYRPE